MLRPTKTYRWITLLLLGLSFRAPCAQVPEVDQRQAEVRRLLGLAAGLLPSIDDLQEHDSLSANLAARQGDAGDFRGASATAEAIPNALSKARVLSMIAISQADQGDWKAAYLTLERIAAPEVRSQTLRSMIGVHIRHGNLEGALEMISSLPPESVERVFGLIGIAHWHARNGRNSEALEVVSKARDSAIMRMNASPTTLEFQQSCHLVSLIGSAQVRFGDRAAGLGTFGVLLSRAQEAPNEMVKKNILLIVARAYAGVGEARLALDLLQEFDASYKNQVLSEIVRERSNARDFQNALTVAGDIVDPQQRDSAYAMIAGSQAAWGDEVGSRETLRLIADSFYRARALETIGSQRIRKKPEEAGMALNQAEREARELPGDRERAELLEHLSGDRARMQDFDRALELALANPLPGQRGRALEGVLGALTFWGQARRAYEIAEQQEVPLVRAYAWMGIAEALQARIVQDRRELEKKKAQ